MTFSNFSSGFLFGSLAGLTLVGLTAAAGLTQTVAPGIRVQPAPIAAPTSPGQPAKIVDGKINDMAVFMVEYVARSTNQSSTDDIVKLVADQKGYVDGIQAKGNLFIAGMFLSDGNRAVLFSAKTEDDARKVVNESPFAKSGYYTLKLRQLNATHAGIVTGGGKAGPTEITATPDSSQL